MVMGVSPILVVFGALYHWYPKITGRMFNDAMGKWHFWLTFLGTYSIYLPMHYLGFLGIPRRYYAYDSFDFIPESANMMNSGITVAALFVAVVQIIFLWNMIWSTFKGKRRHRIRGMPPHLNGKHLTRPRFMVTGVMIYPPYTGGHMTIVCLVRIKTLSRRPSRLKKQR